MTYSERNQLVLENSLFESVMSRARPHPLSSLTAMSPGAEGGEVHRSSMYIVVGLGRLP